jgi:hypothetical protein
MEDRGWKIEHGGWRNMADEMRAKVKLCASLQRLEHLREISREFA